MAMAMIVNNSGMPKKNTPEMKVFNLIGNELLITSGIKGGNRKLITNKIRPSRKRQPGWIVSVFMVSLIDLFLLIRCQPSSPGARPVFTTGAVADQGL